MKKLNGLIALITILLFSIQPAKATHILGGQVSWECLSNGKYVFNLQVYRDCRGVGTAYVNEMLKVYGTPLPTNASNASISSIVVKPDSSRWLAEGNGDLSPRCDFNNPSNSGLDCGMGTSGSVQTFYYQSDPITLKGVPPQNGWDFVYEAVCCRPYATNLTGGSGAQILRSTMYPLNNQAVDSCFDSSPQFAQKPWIPLCREQLIKLNMGATDNDFDTIVYSFDKTYNTPGSNPNPTAYAAGYSHLSPTPDTSFHPANVPSTLEPYSGRLKLKVNNGTGILDYYLVVRADAYREGVKIASVSNEFPLMLFDCPLIDSSHANNPPKFIFGQGDSLEVKVKVGTNLQRAIILSDTNVVSNAPQDIQLTFKSNQFSADFVDTSACLNPPCAIVRNPTPVFDSSINEYALRDTANIVSIFEWRTDNNHILAGDSVGVYYFYLNGQDDFCPIPGKGDSYIKVIVEPLTSNGIQWSNNTLTSLDSVASYQWYDCSVDSIISGETQASFTPSVNGTYAVILQNGNCIDTSDCITVSSVGIEQNTPLSENINFYPNPTKGLVNIEMGVNQGSVQLNVRNIHGQVVQEENFVNLNKVQLQLEGKSGIYFIELTNDKGERANLKVVKH